MIDGGRQPRIRVAAIICREGKLLLVQHLKDGRRTWLLPGGGVEYGESLESALQRELREEAQLDVRVGTLSFVVESISPESTRHVVHLCYRAEADAGIPKRGIDERVVDVRFVGLDELKTMRVHPDIREELLDGLEVGFPAGRHLRVRWID